MSIEQTIQQRIHAIKEQFASNRIEGEVDQQAYLTMLERAKLPISNDDFAQQEIRRIYDKYGIKFCKEDRLRDN